MSDKPYLSATQLNMYARCPEQYRRRYIEGERLPPGIAATRGTGLHQAAAANMRQKVQSHVDQPPTDIIDQAVAAYDAAIHGGVALTAEEVSEGVENVIGENRDLVADLALVHAKQQAPEYQPVLVEREIRLELPGPRDLLGVIDLADDQGRVVDWKTGKKAQSQTEADTSVQLTIYAAAHRAVSGSDPSEVRLDYLTTGSRIKRGVVSSQRGPDDYAALAARFNAVSAAIDAGVFPPAMPGSWFCSARWCGFYENGCPFVNGRRSQGD